MAYALVGSMPAVHGANSPNTTVWGTGQNRTAGNLLICWAEVNSNSASATIDAGWTNAGAFVYCSAGSGNHGTVYLWYLVAAGGDAAPTITQSGRFVYGQLAEFSGNSATPLDQTASSTANATTSPTAGTASTTDQATGELVVFASAATYTATGTAVLATTLNNGGTTAETTNNTTSSVGHYDFGYGITTGNGSDDSASLSFSTTNIVGAGTILASFLLSSLPADNIAVAC